MRLPIAFRSGLRGRLSIHLQRLSSCGFFALESKQLNKTYAWTFRLKGDFSKNWPEIQRVVAALPRSAVVKADETYLHAMFKSRVFQFVDDLELFLEPPETLLL